MFNLHKFVRLRLISILIERNISDAPFAATGSLYFRQQMATVSASKQRDSVQHLFSNYLTDINWSNINHI